MAEEKVTGSEEAAPATTEVEESKEEAKPVVRVPMPAELTAEAASVLPELSPVRSDLETIFMCYIRYAGPNATTTNMEEALEELELVKGMSLPEVDTACTTVAGALSDAWVGLAREFNAMTAETTKDALTPTDVKELNFDRIAERLTHEIGEQKDLKTLAGRLRKEVMETCGKLGRIENPDAQFEEEEELSRREAAAVALSSGLRKIGSSIIREKSREGEEEELPPSWTTPPVVTEDDQLVQLFEKVIMRNVNRADNADQAWHELKTLEFDEERVEEIVTQVTRLAREQIKQSDEIMANVSQEYEGFAGQIEAIQRIRGTVVTVRNFFFPKGERASVAY